MATVEGRNGEDIHEGEDDGEEGGHLPEHIPVPHGREEAADGSEATERLGTLSREDVLHVVNIRGENMPAVLDAGGDALEEAVFDGGGLVDVGKGLDGEAEFEFGSEDAVRAKDSCQLF